MVKCILDIITVFIFVIVIFFTYRVVQAIIVYDIQDIFKNPHLT